ncbi:MAG: hypothetical protein KGH61_01420 [Candidatus Micrarchaeota archaeon]|nr:hypothetical protein [Candidatus Micrarchaeota archaeon]MDE1847590.1 hypothetical protein [Candidatus Micrarchaeota archaeon]MDE1864822.1 hypothetical protein [Candidatus Micrarchaeota archaeon]
MSFSPVIFGTYGFGIAISIIGIMIAVSGISLGLGYALDEKKLKEFGKNEIIQSIINGALVGSLITLFASGGIITDVINSLASGTNTLASCPSYMDANSALCFSYGYLMSIQGYSISGIHYNSVFATVSGLLAALLSLNTLLGVISAIKINLLILSVSFSSILSPIMSEIQYISGILTTLSIGIAVQAALLSFVSITAVSVILPLGIILRTLYATRKLGGFLIAVAIGTYVVLPLTYIFNAATINSYSTSINSTSLTDVSSSMQSASSQLLESTGKSLNQSDSGPFTQIAMSLQSATQQLDESLNSIFAALSYLIMQVFILPAFSLIITGISIREFSQLLGSEAFFGKFRLI